MFCHAKAPVRIGIAGGGTDLPAWTSERDGLCLNLAIDTHTHAVAISRPDKRVIASYRKLDEESCTTEIANGLIRESALMHGFEDSFEVHTLSQVSSHGSGLGVSSSIAVALAACFARMACIRDGITVDPRWQDGGDERFRAAAARDAWTVEIDRLRRPIGRQDHMAATYGGLRTYAFRGTGARVERTFSVEDAAWVADHLLLVQLPEGHDARAILSGVKSSRSLQVAYDAVAVAERAIAERSAPLLGTAIKMGQASKVGIPCAVPEYVASVVESVERLAGVRGCKVAGAGGGGHLIVACDAVEVDLAVREATGGLWVRRVAPDLVGMTSEGMR